MSLVPWPTASAQTTAIRCCHDGTPSIAKTPNKNTNNAFITTLLLNQTEPSPCEVFRKTPVSGQCSLLCSSFLGFHATLPPKKRLRKRLWVVGTIETASAGRAGSDKKIRRERGKGPSNFFFLPDPARPAPAFSIVPTDREPGTG